MKYSIILPCYNIARYIERCLESILTQEYSDYEIIIIDDGSTDNLLEIIQEKYISERRISVYSFSNGGQSAARNRGLRRAKGDWICFVDPDDKLSPNYFEVLERELTNTKGQVDVLIFGYDHNGKKTGDYLARDDISPNEKVIEKILPRIIGTGQADWDSWISIEDKNKHKLGRMVWRLIYRKEFLLNNNLWFDIDIKYGEDRPWLCLVIACTERVITIPDQLYHYMYRADSIMHTRSINLSTIPSLIKSMRIKNELREKKRREKGIDILPMFCGTCMTRKFMIMLYSRRISLTKALKALAEYNNIPAVKESTKMVEISHLPLRMRIAISLLKCHCDYLMLIIIWCLGKINLMKV